MSSAFIRHLKQASRIVSSWPVWKQNILGVPNRKENSNKETIKKADKGRDQESKTNND